MIKQLFDFHTHSTASDGLFSPRDLIFRAKDEGISGVALTDHDTVSGLKEAKDAAKEAGISFAAGIELNIQWGPGEFHLLGLGLKSVSRSMQEVIERARSSRAERNEKIIALMQEKGIEASFPLDLSQIGRPHFADFLVQKGLVKTRQAAFDKYLGKGRPFYAQRTALNMDEAVVAIQESGGIPVIAHPMSLHISWGRMAEVLDDIHGRGVAGLEAWHPSAREADCRRLERMARERGFLVSAGSDWHGEGAARRLGHSGGGHCITSAFVDEELISLLQ